MDKFLFLRTHIKKKKKDNGNATTNYFIFIPKNVLHFYLLISY